MHGAAYSTRRTYARPTELLLQVEEEGEKEDTRSDQPATVITGLALQFAMHG